MTQLQRDVQAIMTPCSVIDRLPIPTFLQNRWRGWNSKKYHQSTSHSRLIFGHWEWSYSRQDYFPIRMNAIVTNTQGSTGRHYSTISTCSSRPILQSWLIWCNLCWGRTRGQGLIGLSWNNMWLRWKRTSGAALSAVKARKRMHFHTSKHSHSKKYKNCYKISLLEQTDTCRNRELHRRWIWLHQKRKMPTESE